MKTLKTLTTLLCFGFACTGFAQSEETDAKDNLSTETVTKIIRIKGANGEEKVIKKEEVITKRSKIKFNPEDEDKVNQTATYSDAEVQVQKSNSSTEIASYTMITDGKGYRMTFLNKTGNQVSKVRPISNNYYIVNLGEKNNGVGHFDADKNFILEMYDAQSDEIMTTIYKSK